MSATYSPGRHEKIGTGDLVRELFNKITEFFRTQLELTKTEIKAESRKFVIAAVFGMAALIIGSAFVFFMGISLILVLAQVVGLAWSSVITTVIYLALAGLAAGLMIGELRKNSGTIDVDVE